MSRLSEKQAIILLWIGAGLFFLFFVIFAWIKYTTLGYNALDLAIYTQVLFNSAQGDWFHMSIFPNNYLGDHVELLIVALAPLYAVFKHPFTLIVFQLLWMTSAIFPLYHLGKIHLNPTAGIILSFIYLSHALVHNIVLFEFHMLSLAIPLVLWMFLAYSMKKFNLYVVMLILLLLVREDVALMVGFFSLIPLVERKSKKWWLTPLLLSLFWFPIALHINGLFGTEAYKYASYYSWMGTSVWNAFSNILQNPLWFLKNTFRWDNTLFIIGLMCCFAFIPFTKPKYLLPTIPIFAQYLLSGAASGEIGLKTHYTSLFIPWFFLSLLFFWKSYQKKLLAFFNGSKIIPAAIGSTVMLYLLITFSPAVHIFHIPTSTDVAFLKQYIQKIPDNHVVVATENILPMIAERNEIHAYKFAFLGSWLFSDQDFATTKSINSLILDSSYYLHYDLTYRINGRDPKAFAQGDDRIRELIETQKLFPKQVEKNWMIFSQEPTDIVLVQALDHLPSTIQEEPILINDQMTLLARESVGDRKISLFFTPIEQTKAPLYMTVKTPNEKYRIPLGYGIFPSTEWKPGYVYQMNIWPNASDVQLQFERLLSGHVRIDEFRSISPQNITTEIQGPTIRLN